MRASRASRTTRFWPAVAAAMLTGCVFSTPFPEGSFDDAGGEEDAISDTDTGDTEESPDMTSPPADFVRIEPGTFVMGSPESELERNSDETQHSVTLTRAFFVDRTEVTQGAWKVLSGGVNPSFFASCGDSCPVEEVDWYSALGFANARSAAEGLPACYTLTGCSDPTNGWKDGEHRGCTGATFVGLDCTGYRLPTESEWEYAARAGTTTATYAGDLSGTEDCTTAQVNLDGIAWWCLNSGYRTQAVGGKAANAWGLRDMLGNVWEWTWDGYGSYPGTVTDPLGATTGSVRVIRGGSWFSGAQFARSASRFYFDPVFRLCYIGLRLARTANP
jgi:formylglycine-generating enzyme required for sulfatase activity